MVISGSGFTGASTVRFGTNAATGFAVNSATQITATTPAGTAGLVDVTVQTLGGTSAVSPGAKYTYVSAGTPAPIIYAVAPETGPLGGGTEVILDGLDLTGTTSVTFGGVPARSFSVLNAGQIRAVTPPGVPGVAEVRVTTPGGTTPVTFWTYFRYGGQQVCFLWFCWWL